VRVRPSSHVRGGRPARRGGIGAGAWHCAIVRSRPCRGSGRQDSRRGARVSPVRSDRARYDDRPPATLRAQLRDLRERGWSIVPLRALVERLRGGSETLPRARLAITVDDGHRTVFTELLPIVREERIPVTLFIYPSAISHAPYALTWEQLAELRASGFVDVQAHTYWHPRFDREKARLAPDAYHDFVAVQLRRSRAALEQHLGTPVDLLAWPFGLYDRELIDLARQHGYLAGFTLERRCVTDADDLMALPRHLVTEATWRATFRTMTKECRR
jgi:peptidoglycan/xylan/chitin deacetylase (PgdA/CDA1 family)